VQDARCLYREPPAFAKAMADNACRIPRAAQTASAKAMAGNGGE